MLSDQATAPHTSPGYVGSKIPVRRWCKCCSRQLSSHSWSRLHSQSSSPSTCRLRSGNTAWTISATQERRLNDMLTTYFESSARSRASWLMSAGRYSIPICRTCAKWHPLLAAQKHGRVHTKGHRRGSAAVVFNYSTSDFARVARDRAAERPPRSI